MTTSKNFTKKLLTWPHIKLESIANAIYKDGASSNAKRMRLWKRLKYDNLGEDEINFIRKEFPELFKPN